MGHDFTKGSIGKKLLLFALPIIVGMLLQTAYNIIDAIYIGMLGPLELAAVSLTFPVVFIFIAVASGLGIGATALISQALGRKDVAAANNVAEHALFFGIVFSIVIAVLGIVFSPAIFTFMGADEELLPLTVQYSTPIFLGLIFMFAWFISDSILKAQGNSITTMKTLGVSVAINIVLNPLLIFGIGPFPQLGLVGAAFATVFARVIAAALNFYYIYGSKSVISLALRYFKPRWDCIKSIVMVGMPASASYTLTAAGFILLTTLVGGFGSHAIAAFGIGMRLNSVAILPIIGMMSAVMAFVGQNIGAGQFDRAKKAALFATRITFVLSLALSAVLFLFPEQVFRIFTQNFLVIGIGKGYLSIIPFIYLLHGFYFVLIGAFNGAGKTHYALATNTIYWGIAVVAAYFLSQSIGLGGIWIAWVLAAAIESVLVTTIFFSGIWLKPGKQLKQQPAGA